MMSASTIFPTSTGLSAALTARRRRTCEGPPGAENAAVTDHESSCRLRFRHRCAVEQFADLRLAGAAIGAGFQPLADGFDVLRTLEDLGRDLALPDTEARADDRPDIFAGFQRLPGQQRHPRLRRERIFRKQVGQPRTRHELVVARDEDASLQSAVANARIAIAADARIAIGDPFDVGLLGAELRAGPVAPAYRPLLHRQLHAPAHARATGNPVTVLR